MKLLVINTTTKDLIKGEYKKGHELDPVKIEEDKYILNYESMKKVEIIKNPHVSFVTDNWFEVGDGSPNDLIYQSYLIEMSKEL